MAGEAIELFIHSQGAKPTVAVAGLHEVLRDVLVRAEVITEGQEEELLVFVSEWEEALTEPDEVENGEDAHVPVDFSLTIEALELHRHPSVPVGVINAHGLCAPLYLPSPEMGGVNGRRIKMGRST